MSDVLLRIKDGIAPVSRLELRYLLFEKIVWNSNE